MLKGSVTQKPDAGFPGWMADKFGFFTRVEEALSYSDFLNKIEPILQDHFMTHVIRVEVDWRPIFEESGDTEYQQDNLDTALQPLRVEVASPDFKGNLIDYTAISRTDIMHLTTRVAYWRRHKDGEGSFVLHIVGIPSLYFKREGETDEGFEKRMKDLDETAPDFQDMMHNYAIQMKEMKENFKEHLAGAFDVASYRKDEEWEDKQWAGIQ